MADISNYLNKIKSAQLGEEVRGSICDGIYAINQEVEEAKTIAGNAKVSNAVELFGGVDSSTPWFIFDSVNFTIRVNADLYVIVNNERALINPSAYPNLITYEVGTTSTKALVYDKKTKALQCISYTGVSSDHWVLFYFNGRAYQLVQPTNFSRRFPYQVDNTLYNL